MTDVAKKTTTRRPAAKKAAVAKDKDASKLTLVLVQERETKGTVRFDSEDEDAAVQSVYVKKPFVDGSVTSITLTVEKN